MDHEAWSNAEVTAWTKEAHRLRYEWDIPFDEAFDMADDFLPTLAGRLAVLEIRVQEVTKPWLDVLEARLQGITKPWVDAHPRLWKWVRQCLGSK